MKKFIIEEDFCAIFPNAKIGVVVCRVIDNSIRDTVFYEKLLTEAQLDARKFFVKEEFSSNPVVAVWREAFTKFKTKKGVRASIEALLKRVHNGNSIGTINPLVDIYNSMSLKYGLPCGGENIDAFSGDIKLTKAKGDEQFVPLGSEENMPPYEGEIVYKDDQGAICRCWNWREAQRTMLTDTTRNAFLCVESIDQAREKEFLDALNELAVLVSKHLGGTAELHVLDNSHREIVISQ